MNLLYPILKFLPRRTGFDPSLKLLTEEQLVNTWGAGGGGGGGVKYDNLEKLYGAQYESAMEQARFEREQIRPRQIEIMQEAEGWGSHANAEQAAQRAGADVMAASSAQQRAVDADMASLGINPADQQYMDRKLAVSNAAVGAQAGGMTGAREGRKREGLGIKQAAVMGMPITSAQQLSNAAQTGTSIANLQMGNQNSRAQGIYNTAAGIGNIASFANSMGWLGAKDGGLIRSYKQGGYVNRSPMVGPEAAPPPPPPDGGGAPQGPSGMQMGMVGANTAMKIPAVKQYVQGAMQDMGLAPGPKALNTVPAEPGYYPDVGVATEGWGGTSEMAQAANAADDLAMTGEIAEGATAATEAATAAEGAATAATAAEGAMAAEGALAATAGTGIGIPLAAAGALALIGHEQGWFADGGQARRGIKARTRGGEVDGPGGPKDDLIPAMLSDGEYVLPVGTVKKYGLARLEKMRQEGLEFERQLGIAG